MRKFYVYVHTCTANGKRYVGITKRKPEYRWGKNGEGYQNNDHFYRAILKYGWSNFQHEVFEVESEEEMYRKEIELISFYHSNDPKFGYNHSVGGERSGLGCKHSEETKKKLSEANRKKWLNPEYRRKQTEARKGKPLSEDHKKHIAEAAKKRCSDPEYKKKMSEAGKRVQKKVHSDPEYRKKISEANKKRCSDPEYKKKMSEIRRGKSFSEEHKKHLSESLKGRTFSEEHRKHLSESQKGKPHKPCSEEAKKKKSEALKGKPKPQVKIKLPDGTIVEISKPNLTKYYINRGKEFEYVSE